MKLTPSKMLVFGSLLGILCRLFDYSTTNLGNIFSQLAIFILLGVLIVYLSISLKEAMLNVLCFSLTLLLSYYILAYFTNGIYHEGMIVFWIIFALITPILAVFVYYSQNNNLFAYIIRVAIVVVSLLSSLILFDRIRVYDILINVILVYLLFFRKRERKP